MPKNENTPVGHRTRHVHVRSLTPLVSKTYSLEKAIPSKSKSSFFASMSSTLEVSNKNGHPSNAHDSWISLFDACKK